MGTAAGPAGTIVAALVGALAGGLAGRGIAEVIEPTAADDYWYRRQDLSSRPYVTRDSQLEETDSDLTRDQERVKDRARRHRGARSSVR
jgi:outer membrane lipoprotein SlyB